MRSERGNKIPSWPDGCFLPIGISSAICKAELGTQSGPMAHVINAPIVSALAAWRVTQGIYRFDPDLYSALIATPLHGALPVDLLHRLPDWCVYIETPSIIVDGMRADGAFVYLDWDVTTEKEELRILLDAQEAWPQLIPVPVPLAPKTTLEESLAMMVESAKIQAAQSKDDLEGLAKTLARDVAPIISLALYLCSDAPDVQDQAGNTLPRAKPTPKKIKGGVRLFAAVRHTVWNAGKKLGKILRQSRDHRPSEDGRQATTPHVRRAHWHTFITGEGSRRDPSKAIPVLRWIHPVLVGVSDKTGIGATVKHVRDK